VAGTGPWLVGSLSDAFEPSTEGSQDRVGESGGEAGTSSSVGLQRALMATQLINLWAAAQFCLAARCLREEALAGDREHGRE
jgi:hypothetical protein